jgi:ABC-2 type transport system permease protein
MSDLGLVIRKELRDILGPSKLRTQTLIGVGSFVVTIDFFLPFVQRDYGSSLGGVLGLSAMISMMVIATSAPDLIAGERERHTLETLLSTRLSDRTLVLGKLTAMMIVATCMSVFVMLQGLPIVSLLYDRWDRTLFFFGLIPLVLLGIIVVTFAMGCLGLIVSSRAQTVQSAQQFLGLAMIPFMFVFFLAPVFTTMGVLVGFEITPSMFEDAANLIILIGVIILAAFIGVGFLLFWWCLVSFRRPKLMLR